MADWSELLPELLIEIANCVTALPDQVSFGGVCKSWQSAALTVKDFNFSLPRSPLLLFPEAETEIEEEEEEESRGLCKLLILPSLMSNLRLPEARRRHCLSSRGWLFTIGEDNNHVNLLHPLTRQQISLPKLDTFSSVNNCDFDCYDYEDLAFAFVFEELHQDHIHDYKRQTLNDQHFVSKMVLSCDPLSQDCLVMVIWGDSHRLGFCRPGDESWKDLAGWNGRAMDIAYHNRLLYCINSDGMIVVCDVHDSNPRILKVADQTEEASRFFLMPFPEPNVIPIPYVLSGFDDKKLLMVVRVLSLAPDFYVTRDYDTIMFHVFELNLETNAVSRVESLGERAILLGYNSTIWITADGSSLKPNSIYFADDYRDGYILSTRGGGKDMGIYSLSEGIVFKPPQFNSETCSKVSIPLWIEPSH